MDADAMIAEREEREARLTAAQAALATQDADFHVVEVCLNLYIEGTPGGSVVFGYDDPNSWELIESDETEHREQSAHNKSDNAALVALVLPQIASALAPWSDHFRSIGMIRADNVRARMLNGIETDGESEDEIGEPTFYLIFRTGGAGSEDIDQDAASLGTFPDVSLPLAAMPAATLKLTSWTDPVNASLLFEALRNCDQPIGRWSGEGTPDLMPQPGEARDTWLNRVALSGECIDRLVDGWDITCGKVDLFAALGIVAGEERDGVTEYVGDLWPRGYASLFYGAPAAGKSTAMHAWMAAVGATDMSQPRTIWGAKLQGRLIGAYISGEDDSRIKNKRRDRLRLEFGPSSFVYRYVTDANIDEIFEYLDGLDALDFVVIDPVRSFLVGNEDKSEPVSDMFNKANTFAARKKCAVVLVTHPGKNSASTEARGSSVFIGRPRLSIYMGRPRRGIVDLTITKTNLDPDEPPFKLIAPENVKRSFRQVPDTMTLVPIVDGAPVPVRPATDPAVAARVLRALAAQIDAGAVMRRTGPAELYRKELPELAGLSRATVRAVIDEEIAAGSIKNADGGLRIKQFCAVSSG